MENMEQGYVTRCEPRCQTDKLKWTEVHEGLRSHTKVDVVLELLVGLTKVPRPLAEMYFNSTSLLWLNT